MRGVIALLLALAALAPVFAGPAAAAPAREPLPALRVIHLGSGNYTVAWTGGGAVVAELNVNVEGGGLKAFASPSSYVLLLSAGDTYVAVTPWWAAIIEGGGWGAVWGPYFAVYRPETREIAVFAAGAEGPQLLGTVEVRGETRAEQPAFDVAGGTLCIYGPNWTAYAPLSGEPLTVSGVAAGGPGALCGGRPSQLLVEELGAAASPWEAAVAVPGVYGLTLVTPWASATVAVRGTVAEALFPAPGVLAVVSYEELERGISAYLTLARFRHAERGGYFILDVESEETPLGSMPYGTIPVYSLTPGPNGSLAIFWGSASVKPFMAQDERFVNLTFRGSGLLLGPGGEPAAWNVSMTWMHPWVFSFPAVRPAEAGAAVARLGSAWVAAFAGSVYDLVGNYPYLAFQRIVSFAGVVYEAAGEAPGGEAVLMRAPEGGEAEFATASSLYYVAAAALAGGRLKVFYAFPEGLEAWEGGAPPALAPLAPASAGGAPGLLYKYVDELGGVYYLLLRAPQASVDTPWGPAPLPFHPRLYGYTVEEAELEASWGPDGSVKAELPPDMASCELAAAGVPSPVGAAVPGLLLEPVEAVVDGGALILNPPGSPSRLYAFLDCKAERKAYTVELAVRRLEEYRATAILAPLPDGRVAVVVYGANQDPPEAAALHVTTPHGRYSIKLPRPGEASYAILPPCTLCLASTGGPAVPVSPPAALEVRPGSPPAPVPLNAASQTIASEGAAVFLAGGAFPIPLAARPAQATPAPEPLEAPQHPQGQAPVQPWTLPAAAALGGLVAGLACSARALWKTSRRRNP